MSMLFELVWLMLGLIFTALLYYDPRRLISAGDKLHRSVANLLEKLHSRNKKIPPEAKKQQNDLYVNSSAEKTGKSSESIWPNVERHQSAIKSVQEPLDDVLTGGKYDPPINNLNQSVVVDSNKCCMCSTCCCCGNFCDYSECACFNSVSSPTGMDAATETPKSHHHDVPVNHHHHHHQHHSQAMVHAATVISPTDLHASQQSSPDSAHSHHRHGHHTRLQTTGANGSVVDLESALRRMGFGARYDRGADDDDNLLTRIPTRFLHRITTASLNWETEWIRLLQSNNKCAICSQNHQQPSPESSPTSSTSNEVTRQNSITSLGGELNVPSSPSVVARKKHHPLNHAPASILSSKNREFLNTRKSSLLESQFSNASITMLKSTVLCVDDLNLDMRKPSRAPKLGRKHVSFDVEIIDLERRKTSLPLPSGLVSTIKEPESILVSTAVTRKPPRLDVSVQTELHFSILPDGSPSPPDFSASSVISISSASSSPLRQECRPVQGHSFTSDSSGFAEDPTPPPMAGVGLESLLMSPQRLNSSTSTASTILVSTSPKPDLFKLTFTTLDSEESARTLTPGEVTPPAARHCSAQERRDQFKSSKIQRFTKSSPAPVERKLKRRKAMADREDFSLSMPFLNNDETKDFDQLMIVGQSELSEEVFAPPPLPTLDRTRSNSEPVMNGMSLELIKRRFTDPVAGSDVEDYYASSLVRSEMENLERILIEARTQIQGLEAAAWTNQEPLQPQLSLGTRMTLESVRVTRMDLITELRRLQKKIQNRQKHLLSEEERESRLRAYQALNIFGSCSGSNFEVSQSAPLDAVGRQSSQFLAPEDPCHCSVVLTELQELRVVMQEQREMLLKLTSHKSS